MPRRRGECGIDGRRIVAAPHQGAAGQRKLRVGTVRPAQLHHRPGHELVDVTLVVGEQDPRLDRPPVGAGIVNEPAQREIDPHGVEQGERPHRALAALPRAVDHLVADIGQHGRREMARQVGDREIAMHELVAFLGDEGIGDLLRARPDLDLGAEFIGQRAQLLEQVLAKERGLRHRRRIKAGRLELRPGAPGEMHRAGRLPVDAQLGIAERGFFPAPSERSPIRCSAPAPRAARCWRRNGDVPGGRRPVRASGCRVRPRSLSCDRQFLSSTGPRASKPVVRWTILSYLHSGLGSGLEPGDAVFDAAVALLVGAVELDAVVERDAAHLEGRFARVCACPLGGASKKPAR